MIFGGKPIIFGNTHMWTRWWGFAILTWSLLTWSLERWSNLDGHICQVNGFIPPAVKVFNFSKSAGDGFSWYSTVVVSHFFYVHPENLGNDQIWLIFLRWVAQPPTRLNLVKLACSDPKTRPFGPLKGSFLEGKRDFLFQGNPCWWNMIIWPDWITHFGGINQTWCKCCW